MSTAEKLFLSESSLFFWTGLLLAFMAVTFNQTLALIYGIMLAVSLGTYAIRKEWGGGQIITNSQKGNTFQNIALAVGALMIFMFVVVSLTTLLQSTLGVPPTLASFFRHQFAATAPLLANSRLLTFIGWGVLIPLLENRLFFGIMYEYIAKQTNVDWRNLRSVSTWILIFVISAVFTWFHIQAKGFQDPVGWVTTFVFGILCCALVSITKELEATNYLHVFNNSLVMLKSWAIV